MMRRINNDHKQFLLKQGDQRLANQNKRLQDAIAIGSEAEVEARDIKINLEGQTRQLEGTRDNVNRINGHLAQGSRLIDVMRRHEMKNKIILM